LKVMQLDKPFELGNLNGEKRGNLEVSCNLLATLISEIKPDNKKTLCIAIIVANPSTSAR
ncbi:MAG: hypothetical protein ABIR84_06070, partial [Candidatus Nitrotoga sp.]